MHLHQFTVFVFLPLLLPLPLRPASSSSLIPKPGCQERCGSVLLPFPFGVGQNCSVSGGSFSLTCNYSTNPPKLFVHGLEIVEIDTTYIRVKYPYITAVACYNMSHMIRNNRYKMDLTATHYTWSEENWLTAIGCDDIVAGIGVGEANQSYGGGCLSYCADGNNPGDIGFCPNNNDRYPPSNGCCRAVIPRGTNTLTTQLQTLRAKERNKKLFSCSYAFIQEKGISNQSAFSYPLSFLDNPTAVQENRWPATMAPPVVRLDWRFGSRENCSQAKNTSGYGCRDNSVCVDFFDPIAGGYHCRCLVGYEGNPYLTGGCHDIDECVDSTSNPCGSNSICINTPGSVNCSCLKGYVGNGWKFTHGKGCIQLPHSKVINNIGIGLSIGLGLLLLILTCFWSHKEWHKRKDRMRKRKFFERNGGLLLQPQINEGTLERTKLFPAKELEKATDHFNESRILGQGGQGTVYKGMFSDGKIVAVKKSTLVDENQLQQFINEVVILSQIIHRNVVKLLGCCLETEVPLLVYEFVPNGTLFDFIHDSYTESPISWNMCLKIAADVAGALAYLHTASSIPIYHRDIKSTNILLDEKHVVKVSDFGTSMSFAVDQTHLTTMVKGTIGYLDPEYFQSGQFTEKSDVYSFGVVLVELLTGQRPVSSGRTQEEKSLVSRFLASMETNTLETILDRKLEEVIAVARVAQRCLNLKGKMRPTMKEVAIELETLRMSKMLSTVKDESEVERVYEAKAITISDNDYTWTTKGNSIASSLSSSSSSDVHPLMSAMV